jgi:hypothetical protein
MELGVDGTFKRRLKLDATPNVPLASLKRDYNMQNLMYTPVIV